MRSTHTLWNTLREAPAGTELPGQQYLLRAGLIRSPAPATWTYLPLGQRAWERLLAFTVGTFQEEGAERVSLPWARPTESSGGWEGGWGADYAPLWAAWDLAARDLRSYKRLPRLLYDLVPHLRPAGQPRTGLLGSAATRRLVLYGFYGQLEEASEAMEALVGRATGRLGTLGLHVATVAAARGRHAWIFQHPAGDTFFLHCDACKLAGRPEAVAVAPPPGEESEMLPMQEVETPDCTTIAGLAEYLDVSPSRTMKVVFYTTASGKVVSAVIRGDLNIDERKLSAALGGEALRPSTDDEIRSVGSVPGYGSPIGLRGVLIVADPTVMGARNLVAGANREPYHVLNANALRDFRVDQVVDVREVHEGDLCPDCGSILSGGHGFELGHGGVALAGDGGQPEATYLDESGRSHPIALCEIVLDLDRLLGAIAEVNHDGDGLRWPAAVGPAQVHLLGIKTSSDAAAGSVAERVYRQVQAAGFEVFYDDRDERPGVAFTDADLLGLPLRVTVSPRSIEAGGLEVKWRGESEKSVVSDGELGELLTRLKA